MTDILTLGLLAAVCAMAVYIGRWPGMILEEVDKAAKSTLPEWAYKPLIGCVYCNAFWWGVGLALVAGAPVMAIAMSGIAAVGITGVLVGAARL